VIFDRRRYFNDNYVYLLAEGDDAVLVDPGDAEVAARLCDDHGVRPRAILHTHGHADHSGGSAALRSSLGVDVIGHRADAGWFAPDADVAGRRELRVGALELRVHEAPGHTPGSVLYEWRGKLLTGDTLFWAGAGNCKHGGDPLRLAETFAQVIAPLDGALEVHPGHDYAERNLPFARALEPGNADVDQRLAQVREAWARGDEPPAPTLEEERRVNPFLRVRRLAPALPGAPRRERDAFVVLRRLRDGWSG
jgi:hydroxyacylglutathione hydrolase